MELADVLDSKSSGSDTVRVRPPLPALQKTLKFLGPWEFFVIQMITIKNKNPGEALIAYSKVLMRQTGLEPVRSRTRPSNVPVCLFQHCRI